MTHEMTIEHLGSDATEQDLAQFRAAVAEVLPAFANEDEAREYVWNNGDLRLSAGWCVYCDTLQADRTIVPDIDDDAWRSLAPLHAVGCEWIATRAHRVSDGRAAHLASDVDEGFYSSMS